MADEDRDPGNSYEDRFEDDDRFREWIGDNLVDRLLREWVPWARLSGIGWAAIGLYGFANVTIGPGRANPVGLTFSGLALVAALLLWFRPSFLAVILAMALAGFTVLGLVYVWQTNNVNNVPAFVIVLYLVVATITTRTWVNGRVVGYQTPDRDAPST